jgi:hypothetical protein
MTITLPDSHRRWLEEQASRSGSSVDRVLTELIEEAWELDEVETKVIAALEGPAPEPMTKNDWERLRLRITNRAAKSDH